MKKQYVNKVNLLRWCAWVAVPLWVVSMFLPYVGLNDTQTVGAAMLFAMGTYSFIQIFMDPQGLWESIPFWILMCQLAYIGLLIASRFFRFERVLLTMFTVVVVGGPAVYVFTSNQVMPGPPFVLKSGYFVWVMSAFCLVCGALPRQINR